MRNPLPAGVGVCSICHTFINPDYVLCYPCSREVQYLDAVVPITYSEHLGQVHTALRGYKDGVVAAKNYATPRLAAILWRFLEAHEPCIARAAGALGSKFDLVTTVPSSTRARDDQRGHLRWIVGTGCRVTADRYERVLRPAPSAPEGREFDPDRYQVARRLEGLDVLLVDGTWTTGSHGQSAAGALKRAGARTAGMVVIGHHIRRDYEAEPGAPNGTKLDALGRFSWGTCCVQA
jgi:predicted amidophosphoribosyltransferase